MMKFGIDLGHGIGPDRGASGYVSEETIINEVGGKVIDGLRALGHTVIELRPTSASSVNNSLWQRYHAADINNVDLCISIHANASNGEGHGTEVFTYRAREIPEARKVLDNLCALGFTNRGIKDGSELAMVRRPTAVAMLIECCFCDNVSDTNLYNNVGADALADAIISGLTGQALRHYKVGWNKDNKGWWYSPDGNNFNHDGFYKIDDEWYYFDGAGYIMSGWICEDGLWYYLEPNHNGSFGKMLTGWQLIGGSWYYLNPVSDGTKGAMVCNKTITIGGVAYRFDESGRWVK